MTQITPVVWKNGVFRPKPSIPSVLRDVNKIRAAKGKPPLAALPRGVPKSVRSCPLAKALDKRVLMFGPTQRLDNFISYFDLGCYPELVSGAAKRKKEESVDR